MLSQLRPAIVSTVFFTLLLGVGLSAGRHRRRRPRLSRPGRRQPDPRRQGPGDRLGPDRPGLRQAGVPASAPLGGRADGYDADRTPAAPTSGPLNPDLAKRVAKGDAAGHRARTTAPAPIPADAVTTSGSGLDPDVSPANAHLQAARIAAARGAPVAEVAGADRRRHQAARGSASSASRAVNVLTTNLALDARYPGGAT